MMITNSIQSHRLQQNRTGGILVVSPTWNILHMNQVACALLQEITPEHALQDQSRPFPPELLDLAEHIKDALLIERMAGLHHSIQLTRTIGTLSQKIVVKAFGLTDSCAPLQYRILFLLSGNPHLTPSNDNSLT